MTMVKVAFSCWTVSRRKTRGVFGSSAVQFGIMLKPRRESIGLLGIVWAGGCGGG